MEFGQDKEKPPLPSVEDIHEAYSAVHNYRNELPPYESSTLGDENVESLDRLSLRHIAAREFIESQGAIFAKIGIDIHDYYTVGDYLKFDYSPLLVPSVTDVAHFSEFLSGLSPQDVQVNTGVSTLLLDVFQNVNGAITKFQSSHRFEVAGSSQFTEEELSIVKNTVSIFRSIYPEYERIDPGIEDSMRNADYVRSRIFVNNLLHYAEQGETEAIAYIMHSHFISSLDYELNGVMHAPVEWYEDLEYGGADKWLSAVTFLTIDSPYNKGAFAQDAKQNLLNALEANIRQLEEECFGLYETSPDPRNLGRIDVPNASHLPYLINLRLAMQGEAFDTELVRKYCEVADQFNVDHNLRSYPLDPDFIINDIEEPEE